MISFSHKTCDQEIREKLAFSDEKAKKEMLLELVSYDFIYEVFIVSTCNRIEIVLATRDNFSSYHTILGLMTQRSGVDFHTIKSTAKVYDDDEAVLHLFSVISSLDSLVIGESQITGQVKEAFRFSWQNGTAGERLERVLAYGIRCAAEVRNVTNISQNPISIASVAVAQAHKLLGDNIQGMTGVVIGTGEMGVLAAKHLLRVGCDVVFIGRDLHKTQKVANSLGENVKADTIDKLPKYINRYKLLFTATSSPNVVVTRDMIENTTIPRIWFDMAIPKDIEEMNFDKLRLFRIDDLQEISYANHSLREEKALEAGVIVDQYKDEFYRWLRVLSVEPVIKQMRLDVEDAIEKEISRAIKKGFIPATYQENIRKMATQMFNRFLHEPTKNLRRSSTEKKNANCVESVKKMFNITPQENSDLERYIEDHHAKGYDI